MSSNNFNTSLAETGKEQINDYVSLIKNNIQSQNVALSQLDSKNKELVHKQEIQEHQLKEIRDKEKLLLTRSRMLQIAQDRNSYKKKVIYTLIALIFLVFILTLVMYVFFTKKINTKV